MGGIASHGCPGGCQRDVWSEHPRTCNSPETVPHLHLSDILGYPTRSPGTSTEGDVFWSSQIIGRVPFEDRFLFLLLPNMPCLGGASPLSSITQLEGFPNKTWTSTVWVIPPKNGVSALKLAIPPHDMCIQNSHCMRRSGGGQFVKMRRDLNVWEFRRGLPVPTSTTR